MQVAEKFDFLCLDKSQVLTRVKADPEVPIADHSLPAL
jgi:hypothetical protein